MPYLLERAEKQWQEIFPELPVADAALIGCLIGVGSNFDRVGLGFLKKYQIGQSEHDVLACARRQQAPYQVTPSTLLEEVRITSGALTTCLNRLIKKSLLVRLKESTDLRSKPVQLTDRGLQLIDEVTAARFFMAGKLLEGLSLEDKTTLRRLLLKLNQSLPQDF